MFESELAGEAPPVGAIVGTLGGFEGALTGVLIGAGGTNRCVVGFLECCHLTHYQGGVREVPAARSRTPL